MSASRLHETRGNCRCCRFHVVCAERSSSLIGRRLHFPRELGGWQRSLPLLSSSAPLPRSCSLRVGCLLRRLSTRRTCEQGSQPHARLSSLWNVAEKGRRVRISAKRGPPNDHGKRSAGSDDESPSMGLVSSNDERSPTTKQREALRRGGRSR